MLFCLETCFLPLAVFAHASLENFACAMKCPISTHILTLILRCGLIHTATCMCTHALNAASALHVQGENEV